MNRKHPEDFARFLASRHAEVKSDVKSLLLAALGGQAHRHDPGYSHQ